MIDWNKITKKEDALFDKILKRAKKLFKEYEIPVPRQLIMDLEAAHIVNPMRLEDWLNADDFNFMHDVSGIRNCINRETGKMNNNFSPRFSRR